MKWPELNQFIAWKPGSQIFLFVCFKEDREEKSKTPKI
jgi:hypothetical protein